ncbi:VIT domain-containing protein [Dankookia sp. GCM10030260]|uniref:VIT domain-containing protein n=1 Tax=Dankookia sp. GCM10030260 TaxID=3273390 RepID=UPI00361145B4
MYPPPLPTPPNETDPLAAWQAGAADRRSGRPIPLSATRIRVLLDGGLAVVRTERVFRNAESQSIEATLTFPVPVHATLFGLAARIDGRLLRGVAQRREAARTQYEAAVDRGRSAVLHEEVLRGVHMLSLAHVPPGAEVTVASDWAVPLAAGEAGVARLRIPVTVGDIYGCSPLAASDDLLTDPGVLHTAEIELACATGTARLEGGPALDAGRARLRLDRPIDIAVAGWAPAPLRGRAADGRQVTLRIAPAPAGDVALNAVVLVDRSGSMGSYGGPRTKHATVVAGLRAAATGLRPEDRVALWEFDDTANAVAPRRGGAGFLGAVEALGPPRGGTDIGAAIAAVLRLGQRDILLVTDGQSHALDVQALARSGRRFGVVLIGAESLEARVGHLAALTGGELLVAGDDAEEAVRLAFAALRRPPPELAPVAVRPAELRAVLAGMRMTARLEPPADGLAQADPWDAGSLLPRAVAAVAAALALPRLPETVAAALAEAEGLCCHLTSLVLVDEAGAVQPGLPAQRKVPLMAPAAAPAMHAPAPASMLGSMLRQRFGGHAARRMAMPGPPAAGRIDIPTFLRQVAPEPGPMEGMPPSAPLPQDVPPIAAEAPSAPGPRAATPASPRALRRAPTGPLAFSRGRVDWTRDPEALRQGRLDGVPQAVVAALDKVAALPEVATLAAALGEAPLVVALALLAGSEASGNRHAEHFARQLLAGADATLLAAARQSADL